MESKCSWSLLASRLLIQTSEPLLLRTGTQVSPVCSWCALIFMASAAVSRLMKPAVIVETSCSASHIVLYLYTINYKRMSLTYVTKLGLPNYGAEEAFYRKYVITHLFSGERHFKLICTPPAPCHQQEPQWQLGFHGLI